MLSAERLAEIGAMMRRWSTERMALPGGELAPSTRVADAGLDLLTHIADLTADLGAARADASELRDLNERFADLAQLVLDRITNGATNDERYLMKDTARIAMDQYRALAARRGGGEGAS